MKLPEITAADEQWCCNNHLGTMQWATILHRGQVDRGGAPYVDHVFYVAERQPTFAGRVIGLLHDAIEDGKTTAAEMRSRGYPESIVTRVLVLTRDPAQDYEAYVLGCAQDIVTLGVKKIDLKHNLHLDRLPKFTRSDFKRVERYFLMYRLLVDIENDSEPRTRPVTLLAKSYR